MIIRIEGAYIKSKREINTFKVLELEKYQIIATLDNITSKICQESDLTMKKNKKKKVKGECYPEDTYFIQDDTDYEEMNKYKDYKLTPDQKAELDKISDRVFKKYVLKK